MTDSQHSRPLVFGVALAPAASVYGMLAWVNGGFVPLAQWQGFLMFYAVALVGVLLLGLPVVLYLRRRGKLTWLTVLGASLVAGNLYYQLLAIFLSEGFSPDQLLLGSLAGALAGVGFCVGAWPNNSFKPNPHRGGA